MREALGRALALAGLVLVTACQTTSPSASPSATATATLASSATARATPTSSPTATPEPENSLELPGERDPRQLGVTVEPALTETGGRIVVTVTNLSDTRIGEIVLRWSTELGGTIFLAPFVPTPERVEEFGPPLTPSTHWSKWVEGPGEQGEPAGTTSLGYGPMDPGMTLEIPLHVTRRAEGPVGFDLQLLDGEAILSLEGGEPAELRVAAP